MDVLRRRSLLTAGLTAGVALAGCTATDPQAADAAFDPGDWDSVRAQFAFDPDIVQLAAFVLAAHPKPVRDAIDRHRAGSTATPSITSRPTAAPRTTCDRRPPPTWIPRRRTWH
jgi:hypothetical protein